MRRITALSVICTVVLVGVTTSVSVLTSRKLSLEELTNFRVIEAEAKSATWTLLVLISLFLLSESVRRARLERSHTNNDVVPLSFRRVVAWMSGLLAVNTVDLNSTSQQSPQSHGLAADASLSPIAAGMVLSHIIQRRRKQLQTRDVPDVLTIAEMEALARIRNQAVIGTVPDEVVDQCESTPDVNLVLNAVDRRLPNDEIIECTRRPEPWLVEVKLFGYPMAVSADGTVAEFRKKRSLELLTWLVLNRDRARRSTARTAMWDVSVSDSSFSTVVSDLRRGLRDAVGSSECEFVPTTYTDEIPLSNLIVTDAERLSVEYQRFKEAQVMSAEFRSLLAGMRDIPLAGTAYSWADLDGTTTRLVMSALTITVDVAYIALDQGALDDAMLASSAGLRVFPGCDELLDIQRACLQKIAH